MDSKTHVTLPKGPCLIVLVGPSGAGKSTFVKEHFEEREVVSSDDLRTWMTGQFERQDKNQSVFEEFHHRLATLIKSGNRAVADATHLRNADRKRTAEIGYQLNVPVYYVVINRSVVGKMQTGGWRNAVRIKGRSLIEAHEETFMANEKTILSGDGQNWVTVVDTRDPDLVVTTAQALPRVKSGDRDAAGPLEFLHSNGFKTIRVIADVHGNFDGLVEATINTPDDTFFLFLGDITDYGPESWKCVYTVNALVSSGLAIMTRGNHDKKMARYIEQTANGGTYGGQLTYGMDISTNQLKAMMPETAERHKQTFISLVEQSPDWIELGDWMFAHAAIDPKMWDNTLFRAHRNSKLETMAIYGESTGETDEKGFPIRTYEWIKDMPVRKNAVVGHQIMSTEAPVVERHPNGGQVVFLDTGSSKDGFLSYWDFEITTGGRDLWNIKPSDTFGKA